jgi:DMSO/TMAO reductase YedYZ heme-binding membrane subunit
MAVTAETQPRLARYGTTTLDRWMAVQVRLAGREVKRQTLALIILGAPALLPLLFTMPAMLTGNGPALDTGEADTLGTGSEILLITTLFISPMVTLTRQRWFVPLRRWYGIMFGVSALADGIIASITADFAGGPLGRVAGHSFLLVGLVMVVLLIPLLLTANTRAQLWLGRYWKLLHQLIYVVWALLLVHLALLEGFGFQRGLNGSGQGPDGLAPFHQRLYQLAACSVFLLLLRLPSAKRWLADKQAQDKQRVIWLTVAPLIALSLLAFAFIVDEELFKGVALLRLHPVEA